MSFFHGENEYACTVDGNHPNDVGFLCMADSVGSVARHILEKNSRR